MDSHIWCYIHTYVSIGVLQKDIYRNLVSKRASKQLDDKNRQLNILYHSNKYHLY